jgi:hypothetical protein
VTRDTDKWPWSDRQGMGGVRAHSCHDNMRRGGGGEPDASGRGSQPSWGVHSRTPIVVGADRGQSLENWRSLPGSQSESCRAVTGLCVADSSRAEVKKMKVITGAEACRAPSGLSSGHLCPLVFLCVFLEGPRILSPLKSGPPEVLWVSRSWAGTGQKPGWAHLLGPLEQMSPNRVT